MNYGSIVVMKKSDAIQILGGSISAAADAIGASYQAVSKWPEILPRRIEDRVIAAVARKRLPPEAFLPPQQDSNTSTPVEAAHG